MNDRECEDGGFKPMNAFGMTRDGRTGTHKSDDKGFEGSLYLCDRRNPTPGISVSPCCPALRSGGFTIPIGTELSLSQPHYLP